MNINCPYCGTEYEIAQKDFARSATCEASGNNFVIGAKSEVGTNAANKALQSVSVRSSNNIAIWVCIAIRATVIFFLIACFCVAPASGEDNAYPRSAKEAIAGALANVRNRYHTKLDHYGLTESYFDDTSGICDLMLIENQRWMKYQIVYYRSTDEILWPRTMPKGVAKDLMQDRLLIQKYELGLYNEERGCNRSDRGQITDVEERKVRVQALYHQHGIDKEFDPTKDPTKIKETQAERPKPAYKPLWEEESLTPEQQALEERLKKEGDADLAALLKRQKQRTIAEQSQIRRMATLPYCQH